MKPCSKDNCIYPVFSNGYCKQHQYLRKDEKYKESRKSPIQKHFEKMKANGLVNENGGLIVSKAEEWLEENELNKWFDKIAKRLSMKPYCWETADFIHEGDYRAATAHIFPKNIFKSIATHPLNFLILSPRNGSHDLSHRLDKFSKMNVWPIAVKRYLQFKHLIIEKHKYLNEFDKLATEYIELHNTKPAI